MKQLLVCHKDNRKLVVRANIPTDVFVPIEDIISPQKTDLIIPKNDKIELGDIIIIKDNNTGVIEYIGYIDTLVTKVNTEISCYPLINVFDNDFILDQMYKASTNKDGTEVDIAVDAVTWLETQIKRAFIDTDDDLQALPLDINKTTKAPVLYKKVIDTSNLFEAYIDLFINTGVYVVFNGLSYERNEIVGINCEIKCNRDESIYSIYESDPTIQNVVITDNTFNNYNKIIAIEDFGQDEDGNPIIKEDDDGNIIQPQIYYFYLLNNNDITMDANDDRRIKQVRSKAISFSLEEGGTQQENANALILAIYNELQAPEYDLKIEIDMLKNDNLFLYRNINFVSNKVANGQNIVYNSNITKIERLNDKQVRITLGALRNSLTDFKKKVEAI